MSPKTVIDKFEAELQECILRKARAEAEKAEHEAELSKAYLDHAKMFLNNDPAEALKRLS